MARKCFIILTLIHLQTIDVGNVLHKIILTTYNSLMKVTRILCYRLERGQVVRILRLFLYELIVRTLWVAAD